MAFNGIQNRARLSKIQSDVSQLKKAILIACGDNPIGLITGFYTSADLCVQKPNGTDFVTLNKSSDGCWTRYAAALDKISLASNIDARNPVEPWGRLYFINENEGEVPANPCRADAVEAFSYPFSSSGNYSATGA